MEDNAVEKIAYRQYVQGKFLNGSEFSANDTGIVDIQNNYLRNRGRLEHGLENVLAFFKDQPRVFIEPKISEDREFSDGENCLEKMIQEPVSAIIVAQPQFGLTCLSHYMRLAAYKLGAFWILLDANHTKARNVASEIDMQLKDFDEDRGSIKCIIIDAWDSSEIDLVVHTCSPWLVLKGNTEIGFKVKTILHL